MARSMVQSLQSDRMAISEEGQVAVIKTLENCIEIYGEDVDFGIEWMARRIAVGLLKPCDLCFAPNNALVVSDIGDDTLKIYDLKGDLQLKNQIVVCRDTLGRLMVRELNSDFRMIKFRTSGVPVTVVIGPGPLSQLFITRRTEVILVNVDWNKVSLVSYLLISSPLDWRLLQFDKRSICDNVSSVKDHKNNHKVGGFNPMAITEAQFCGMFYHVAETNRTRFSCLERSKCNVGIRGDRRKFSETVVIYVRITEENGRLLFHARYGNCYEGAYESTTHAEYFMLVDDDFREAVKILQNQNGGDINLFMNKQPCYKSTGHGKKTDLKMKAPKECEKASLVHDHRENHRLGGRNPLAITKAQFCAMFYHVTERTRGNIDYKCLQKWKCRVGKMAKQANPRSDYAASIVIYVRLTDQKGRVIFHARYGNCFDGERRKTIQADYFMLMDDEFKEAVRLLYKVDMPPTPQFKEDITNGLEGMHKMIAAGIELKAMTEESW
ncbi:hypothetical protein AWC38_SpisGene528 [Stylophora pistillata]|uniref:Uncharacterized protein n=1 Tax=Stylophora pistillata TaxID=50429 RepID=A0A2B4T174_STYPI|nr:hypothetical protein AWC38_SpisGene528 [Stylophora pistillata]